MSAPPPPDARWRPVAALAILGLCMVALSSLCPPDGWQVAGVPIRLHMPAAWHTMWAPESNDVPVVPRWKPEDVEDLLAAYDAQLTEAEAPLLPDSTQATSVVQGPDSLPEDSATAGLVQALPAGVNAQADSTPMPAGAPPIAAKPAAVSVPQAADWVPGALRIRIPESNPSLMDRLWAQLQSGEDVHILHYGDSQIEGDRISGTVRERWQTRWGGFGPGIQPPVPLVQSFALRQPNEGPWKRHTRFGRRDTTDLDENYGLLASYADAAAEATEAGAPLCLGIGREPRSHKGFGMWTGLELWHDTVHQDCILSLSGSPVDTLIKGQLPGVVRFPGSALMPGDPDLEVCFSAPPPRLFALHPIGGGVQWHGVAMRGSSGTLFRKLERRAFANQLSRLSPDLVVLQFGGNSVPYCADTAAARRYAGWMKRQIQLFQALQPQTAILVIGPSDMAEKTGLNWTSYPMLSPLRDALLEASLDAGAAYWDLLEVMGGLGSMPAWVQATPPLAGPDHVHFTPRGARKVGELLDRALWAEFRRWKQGGDHTPLESITPRSASQVQLHHAGKDAP